MTILVSTNVRLKYNKLLLDNFLGIAHLTLSNIVHDQGTIKPEGKERGIRRQSM